MRTILVSSAINEKCEIIQKRKLPPELKKNNTEKTNTLRKSNMTDNR